MCAQEMADPTKSARARSRTHAAIRAIGAIPPFLLCGASAPFWHPGPNYTSWPPTWCAVPVGGAACCALS